MGLGCDVCLLEESRRSPSTGTYPSEHLDKAPSNNEEEMGV